MGAVDTRRNLLNGGALNQRVNTQPLKTHEAHIAFDRLALTIKSIHRSLFVAVANGNAAEEDVSLIRHANKLFDKLCMHGEEFLRACVQTFTTQQQHDCLQPHANI